MAFQILRGDVTRMEVDAIVNAANSTLLSGGGQSGGQTQPPSQIQQPGQSGCSTGEAKLTGAYNLPCKYVIHTVGPIWNGGGHGERELLAACYRNCLRIAKEKGCRSLAFPLISAGIFGYPKDQAREVAE